MTICSQYGSINSHTVLLGKSYTSAPHVKLQKREKAFQMYLSLGTQVLSTLPAGTHPMFTKTASLDALYVKVQVRPPEKVKMRKFHL